MTITVAMRSRIHKLMAMGKKNKFGSVRRGWAMNEIVQHLGKEYGTNVIKEFQDYIIWFCKQTTSGKSALDTVHVDYSKNFIKYTTGVGHAQEKE